MRENLAWTDLLEWISLSLIIPWVKSTCKTTSVVTIFHLSRIICECIAIMISLQLRLCIFHRIRQIYKCLLEKKSVILFECNQSIIEMYYLSTYINLHRISFSILYKWHLLYIKLTSYQMQKSDDAWAKILVSLFFLHQ